MPTTSEMLVLATDNRDLLSDPFGGPAPIAYIGPGALGGLLIALLLGESGHSGPITFVIAAALAILTAAATALTITVGLARANRRTIARGTALLAWAEDASDRATIRRFVALARHHQLPLDRTLESWQSVGRLAGSEVLTRALLRGAVRSDHIELAASVTDACYPSTVHGWQTDRDHCDLAPLALAELVESGTFAGTDFRSALRRQLGAMA